MPVCATVELTAVNIS